MYLGAEEPGGLTLAMTREKSNTCCPVSLKQFFFTMGLSMHRVFSFSTEVNNISVVSS